MKILEDDKIILRTYEDSDVDEYLMAINESANTVGCWMDWWKIDYSRHDALDWFNYCTESRKSGMSFEFGIFSKDNGKFLGGAGINQIDKVNGIGNVGYWVRETCQKRGTALRALNILLNYGLCQLRLNRLEIVILEKNTPSKNVVEKSSATLECLARNRLVHKGVSHPAYVYVVTPSKF